MLKYSADRGLLNCLYTNGFRLGYEPELANLLLAPVSGMVFIRMSINAVSPAAVRNHWGLDPK
jgi:hypothetical protein